jgi:hypothetical protein
MPDFRRQTIATLAVLVAALALPVSAGMRLAGDEALGFVPTAVAVDPVARKAYLLRHDHMEPAPSIKVVDLDTLAMSEIAVVSFPYRLSVDAAKSRLYVTHQSPALGDGVLSVIDTRAGRVVESRYFAQYPGAIVADFARGELYVAEEWQRRLWVVRADRLDQSDEIDLGADYHAADLAVDRVRGRIVVGNWNGSPIGVVDRGTRALIGTHAIDDESWLFDGGAESVAIDERRGLAYVMHTSGELSILQGPEYRPVAELPDAWGMHYHNEHSALSLAWNGLFQVGHGWLGHTDEPDRALRAVDGADGSERFAAIPGDDRHWARTMVVDDDGGDLYVTAGKSAQSLHRIDPATLEVRETLALPGVVGELSFRDPLTGRVYVAGSRRLVAVDTQGSRAGTRIATGFRHVAFDHYFVTADPVERRLIDDGRHGSDWVPGEDLFRVWTEPVAGSVPVCRFFSARFAPQSTHVYTPHTSECEALKRGGDWQYEGVAFHVALPNATGACPTGTEPLYRLYNNGGGGAPNHRHTASRQVVAAMAAQGWSAEGVGADRVFACTPALR